MNVTALYFSPTGGSKRSALSLAAALAPEGFAELDITCGAVAGDFGPGDVVVFSVPCYNGRVPEVAAGRLEQVHGHRTPCIISITYGNRDYDDSLLEYDGHTLSLAARRLRDMLTEDAAAGDAL